MLFKKAFVDDVLTGRKRQTLRLKQPRVTPGRTYAVQTSYYTTALGRIRVTGVRPCTLADLTPADIAAEGWGRRRRAFETYFATINHFQPETMTPREWQALRRRPLWCITFEPAGEGA